MKLILWSLLSLLTLVAISQSGFAQSQDDGRYDEVKIERIKYIGNNFKLQSHKCGEQYDSSYWKSCAQGSCREGRSASEALNECHKWSDYPEKCGRAIKITDTSVYRCDD